MDSLAWAAGASSVGGMHWLLVSGGHSGRPGPGLLTPAGRRRCRCAPAPPGARQLCSGRPGQESSASSSARMRLWTSSEGLLSRAFFKAGSADLSNLPSATVAFCRTPKSSLARSVISAASFSGFSGITGASCSFSKGTLCSWTATSVHTARSAFAASSLPRSAHSRASSAAASFRFSWDTLGTAQMSTVVSEFPEARRRPSGEKATRAKRL